jgi:hypothetical protein
MAVSIVILVKTDYDIHSEILIVKLVGFKKVTVIVVVCTDTVPGA